MRRFLAWTVAAAALPALLPAVALAGGTAVLTPAELPHPAAPVHAEHPFRTFDPGAYEAAKSRAQAQATLGAPLGPLELAPTAPSAVLPAGLNQPGLVAGDNAARNNGTPPDPTGAVGPSHYLEFVNSVVRAYGKNLTTVAGTAQLDDFVGSTNHAVFDPQIQYDPVADRWFYLADDCSVGDCSSGNFLAFGWSKTSDPSDLVSGWCRYFIQTDSGGNGFFDDYPKLGHNNNHLIFGTNVFDLAGNFVSARIWTVPKPAAGAITTCPAAGTANYFSGSAASPVKNGNISTSPLRTSDNQFAFTPVPANNQDSNANGYVIAADSPSPNASQLMVWHVSGAVGGETLTADGNVNVTSYQMPAAVPQPGTTDVLDSSDTRLTQAVAHADPDAAATAIWTQHTIKSGARSAVRWYEIVPGNTAPRQQGDLTDATSFVFNGAVSPTMAGNEAVVQYNVGGSAQLAQIRASSRVSADTLGTMSGELTLGTSTNADQDFSCPSQDPTSSSCRWGDYAAATPDPASTHRVWGTNQLLGAPSTSNPHWTTRNFALLPADRPFASFTATPNPGFTGKSVNFDAAASQPTSAGTIDKYEWDLDGNGTFETDTGTTNHMSMTYGSPQTINVGLRITSGALTDTTTRSLTIVSNAPTASFTATPSTAVKGDSVQFDGSASADAEPGGTIASYQWDFDDGSTDTTTVPTTSHAYAAAGTYHPTLTVVDTDDGASSTAATRTVTVVNPTPVAAFTVSPNPAFTNKTVTLDGSASSVPGGGTIDKYEWDLDGDGTFETDTGTTDHVTTQYAQPQVIDVGLRVTAAGVTNVTTHSLTVQSGAPTASFTVSPATTTRGTVVGFDGSASTDAEAPGGIASYAWDFDGNGTVDQTTSAPTVAHSYTGLGTFNARLTVTDGDDGATSAPVARTVTVQNIPPVAQLAFSPLQPKTGETVTFSAVSSSDQDGSIAAYRWDLDGDGVFETNTGPTPTATRTYSTPGNFTVGVQVQDNDGSVNSATGSVPVAAGATSNPVPFALGLTAGRSIRLRTLLKNGISPVVSCNAPCTVKLTLTVPRTLARSLKIKMTVGKATATLTASGRKRVRIRLSSAARKRLAKAKGFKLRLTGSAFDRQGNSSSARKTVTVKR